MPISWKPEVLVDGAWIINSLRFATKEEAERSARRLLMSWFAPVDSRASESSDPVNYFNTPDQGDKPIDQKG
jgi:hypothetical protein